MRWKLGAVIVIAALALSCAVATAQYSRVPKAMTAAELARYGELLALSEEQRIAVELQFEAYLDEFEPLRAEMIEAAVRHPKHSSRDADKKLLKEIPRFVAAVRGMDEALFGRIESLLVHEQQQRMPRVRLLRERALYANLEASARFVGENIPDLRELIESLRPPADVLQALAPRLDGYEARLTRELRNVFDVAIRVCTTEATDGVDILIATVRSLRAMNREAFETFSALLPIELRDQLHDSFHRRAYGQAVDASQMYVLPQLDAALKLTELAQSERDAITRLRAEARHAQRESQRELVELLDREAIIHAPPGGAVGSQEYLDLVNATREKVMQHDRELAATLHALLGEQRATIVKQARIDPVSTHGGWSYACGVVTFVDSKTPSRPMVSVPVWRRNPLLARSIEVDEFGDYIEALGAVDEQRDAACASYRDYVESVDQELLDLRSEDVRLSMPMRPEKREGIDPLARANQAREVRARIREVVRNADASFLERLRLILDRDAEDAAWSRVIRMRQRSMLSLDLVLRPEPDSNRSAEIDLMRLIGRLKLDQEQFEDLEEITKEYETQLHALLAAQFELYEKHSYFELAMRDGWRGDGDANYHARHRDQMEDLHSKHHAIAALNAQTLIRVLQLLPMEAAALLLDAYNRRAFPDAYDDPASMAPALDRALALDDLSVDQRDRIAELRLEFISVMEDVHGRMAGVCAALPPDLPGVGRTMTPQRTSSHEKFKQEFEQLTDMRASINRRVLRGLRTALAPAQLRRVSLPEVE